MASIRRTLSPANHDRSIPYQNGSDPSPLSVGSPFHKLQSNSKPSLVPLSLFFAGPFRFFAEAFSPQKQSRRGQSSWKRSIFRCALFFVTGFLLGVLPFAHIDDVRTRDFSFEIKPAEIHAEEEENVKDVLINRPVYVDLAMLQAIDLQERLDYRPRKLLIVVTPTYNRPFQAYYLNRLGQLLRLINPPVLWIVVETGDQSAETAEILRKTGVVYRHLVCKKSLTNIKDRGVQQRNTALEHIEMHRLDGIVYFADDDNIFSLELFEKMRDIRRFGTWPVGMLAQSKNKAILEGPVCNGSQVIGWQTNEKSKRLRRFHVDMSGFAFNSTILWDPKRWRRPYLNPIRQLDTVKEGFQETTFIEQVVADESQMEGIPEGCGRVMNWHLHLKPHLTGYPGGWLLPENLDIVDTIN